MIFQSLAVTGVNRAKRSAAIKLLFNDFSGPDWNVNYHRREDDGGVRVCLQNSMGLML